MTVSVLAERRSVIATALRLCATLDGPLHEQYAWARFCRDLDSVYAVVVETNEQRVLPHKLAGLSGDPAAGFSGAAGGS